MSPTRISPLPSLAGSEWLKWPETRDIFTALSARGDEARVVGGAVRDSLLKRTVRDVDLATTAKPERIMELAALAGLKTIPTGLAHGTVTIMSGARAFEVTTLRRDVETDGRHAKVAYTDDWAADAGRRDFTINALYADAQGALFDPLGVFGDIESRRVRFIGDARARVREDYLRILRFFRFNAELETEHFDGEGLRACVIEHAGLNALSPERVGSELIRLLRAGGVIRALWKMFDFGLLVQILGGVPYLTRLERLTAIEAELGMERDAVLRLAGLAVAGLEDADRLSERLRLSNAQKKRLRQASATQGLNAGMDEGQVRRALYARGRSWCRDAALMAWAESGEPVSDAGWRGLITRIENLPVPEFPLQGSDIVQLGVPQGPTVGEILKSIEARWIAGGFGDGKTELLEMARGLIRLKSGEA